MSFAPPPGRGGPQHIPRPPDARLGGPPSWADLRPEQRRLSVEQLLPLVDPLGGVEIFDRTGAMEVVMPELSGLKGVVQGPNHHLDV